MREWLQEADWKAGPEEVAETSELVTLIRLLQYYVSPPEQGEEEWYENLKSLEGLVQVYDYVSDVDNIGYVVEEEDEDDKEEAREDYIATEVSDARDNMKEGLEKTIVYLASCVTKATVHMFEESTRDNHADPDT